MGGADADLILDDMLVDVKTTKNFQLDRVVFDQLIGYVLLARIGGIDNVGRLAEPIDRVAIYFARYGALVPWPLASMASDQAMAHAVEWVRAHLPILSSGLSGKARPNQRSQPTTARRQSKSRGKKR